MKRKKLPVEIELAFHEASEIDLTKNCRAIDVPDND